MKSRIIVVAALLLSVSLRADPLGDRIADAKVTVKGKSGYWAGSVQYTIDFEGWTAQLVEPKEPRGDGAWVWCMKWPGAFSAFTGQEDAVRRGYRYVYLDDKLWMNDEGVAKAKRFHDFLVTKLGFARKAFLIGMSWGGFYSTRYAAAHPEDVAKIYYDAPLMGFHAFNIRGWKESAVAWGLTPEQKTDPDWRHDPRMPINLGEKIARAGIPILLLYGGVDDVVKPAENCEIFLKGFRSAGGKAKVIRRDDFGHHPHGFVDPSQRGWIVDFFEGRDFTYDPAFDAIVRRAYNDAVRNKQARKAPKDKSAVAQELGKYAGSAELPGVVSGIMSADGKVTIECFGYADIAARRPMRPDTLFWIASNTKGIAAALFLTVWDEGKVALDDPVEKYLPEFAGIRVADTNAPGGARAPKSKPTVRQLLSHTSGLKFFPQMPIDQWPMRLLADKAAHTPFQSDPGTQYAYSNWGIDCAMAIVESVTGKPWDVLLKERILDPLGMTDTTFFPTEEQMSRLAQIYILKDGQEPKLFKSVDQFQWPYSLHTRYAEAGGGLFSTATDMVRFFGMLARGGVSVDGKRILSEKAMAEWCRKQTPEAVKTNYSFGMRVDPVDHFIAHGGAYGTFGAANWAKHDVHVFMVQMMGSSKLYNEYKNAWFRSVKTMLSDKVEGNRPPAAR